MMPFFCQFFQKRNIFYLIVLEGAAIALCWWWSSRSVRYIEGIKMDFPYVVPNPYARLYEEEVLKSEQKKEKEDG